MLTFRSLSELAAQIVEEMEQARPSLQAKLLKIQAQLREMETEKQEVEAKLRAANLAPKRLADYRLKGGVQNECPSCFILDEVRSPMAAVGASEVEDNPLGNDAFKCQTCSLEALIGR